MLHLMRCENGRFTAAGADFVAPSDMMDGRFKIA
jgi:delta-aminolevulinic acid dehydratase/porphobilinogen synthase